MDELSEVQARKALADCEMVGRPLTADEARVIGLTLRRMEEVLRSISQRGCGVPGHAVARGCGANYVAARAVEGKYLRYCPDCQGNGTVMKFTRIVNGATSPTYEPCETCDRVGFLDVE